MNSDNSVILPLFFSVVFLLAAASGNSLLIAITGAVFMIYYLRNDR